MRLFLVVLAMVLAVASVPAFADVYDDIWIKECIQDNQDQGQTSETIRIYCKCMNEHMSNSETRSITTWEKTHPEEREFCSDMAQWRGR
ncbi:MAG: hypothetical protein WAW37_17735 [Syntrophobacteraceae bacterium]